MDPISIASNIAKSLLPVQSLISGFAYIMGILFIFKALMTLKQHGESKGSMSSNSSMKEPLVYFIVGGLLIYFPTTFEVVMNSTFGYSSVLAYSQESTMAGWLGGDNQLGLAITTIIQTIGLYAFVRGWVLIVRATSTGQPPGGVGKGLTHVFGGVLAINIVGTIELVNNTLTG
ncbi:MAG: type IV secretion protein IcmC [Legionella sp. 21-45-4]|nr:MAG: type IV secretion protein IcmC [Legionella sp. 21-45-4]